MLFYWTWVTKPFFQFLEQQQKRRLILFYMGFWRYVNTWGGSKGSPPVKIYQNDSNLGKRHVLAKIDHSCPLFMHLESNYYHFWPKIGPKNKPIFTCIEGSPLWIVRGKNCQLKFFWKFLKEIPKMANPGPFYRVPHIYLNAFLVV